MPLVMTVWIGTRDWVVHGVVEYVRRRQVRVFVPPIWALHMTYGQANANVQSCGSAGVAGACAP
jgi:hypothetical protein